MFAPRVSFTNNIEGVISIYQCYRLPSQRSRSAAAGLDQKEAENPEQGRTGGPNSPGLFGTGRQLNLEQRPSPSQPQAKIINVINVSQKHFRRETNLLQKVPELLNVAVM